MRNTLSLLLVLGGISPAATEPAAAAKSNRSWLYDTLRLFNGYRVRRDGLKAAPA